MTDDRLVLGLHPSTRGFGWVLFEKRFAPLDWGVVEKRTGTKNVQCLFAIGQILERYKPDVLSLEDYETPPRSPRIRQLCRSVVSTAEGRNIEVCIYGRAEIGGVFAQWNAASRYEIARVIAQRIAPFRARLPKARAAWDNEKPGMSLFNAAAVATAHYVLDDPTPP